MNPDYLNVIFQTLNDSGLEYCIQNGYEDMPYSFPTVFPGQHPTCGKNVLSSGSPYRAGDSVVGKPVPEAFHNDLRSRLEHLAEPAARCDAAGDRLEDHREHHHAV